MEFVIIVLDMYIEKFDILEKYYKKIIKKFIRNINKIY